MSRRDHPTSLRSMGVAIIILAVACGDPTRPQPASFPSTLRAFTLGPLTGSGPTTPTALTYTGGVALTAHADATWRFDVAFDLDATGLTRVLPVHAVASDLGPAVKRVGLQLVKESFDQLSEAPRTGYDTLSVLTVGVGQVVALEIRDDLCQLNVASDVLYAKLTIDSVNYASRRLYVRTVVDPNCGYRGLVPDSIPGA